MRHRRQHYRKPAHSYVIALPPVTRRFTSTQACRVWMIRRRDSPSTPSPHGPRYCVKRRNKRTANYRQGHPNFFMSLARKCPPQAENRTRLQPPQLPRPKTFIERSKPSSLRSQNSAWSRRGNGSSPSWFNPESTSDRIQSSTMTGRKQRTYRSHSIRIRESSLKRIPRITSLHKP